MKEKAAAWYLVPHCVTYISHEAEMTEQGNSDEALMYHVIIDN